MTTPSTAHAATRGSGSSLRVDNGSIRRTLGLDSGWSKRIDLVPEAPELGFEGLHAVGEVTHPREERHKKPNQH